MSSAEKAASIMRNLEGPDFRVLQAVELGMGQRRFVPFVDIGKYTGFSVSEIQFRVNKLHREGLLYHRTQPYIGYSLNYLAYDCLAVHALVQAGILEGFGKSLGVGKEADVYDAVTPTGEQVAVKFHRIGRTSFRDIRRKRGYEGEQGHTSWLHRSRLSAEKEFEGLEKVYAVGVAAPRPIKQNRHVIVMTIIEGLELADVRVVKNPRRVLNEILHNIRVAYGKAGVVHADLSEYNIIIKPDEHILIIDWPQYVTKDHPNARDLLERDVGNVLTYFLRKFGVERSLEKTMHFVMQRFRASIPQREANTKMPL